MALAVALEGLLAGPVDTARKPDALGAVGGLPATVELRTRESCCTCQRFFLLPYLALTLLGR